MQPNRATLQSTREAAEMLAIQALSFLSQEPETLSRFLDMTGIPPGELRAAASTPGFLAGAIEHILADENLLIAFAQSAGIDPAEVVRASRALGGQWERDLP